MLRRNGPVVIREVRGVSPDNLLSYPTDSHDSSDVVYTRRQGN